MCLVPNGVIKYSQYFTHLIKPVTRAYSGDLVKNIKIPKYILLYLNTHIRMIRVHINIFIHKWMCPNSPNGFCQVVLFALAVHCSVFLKRCVK